MTGRPRYFAGHWASNFAVPLGNERRFLDGLNPTAASTVAPAIDGAFLLSIRGGDFELRIGQDLSIGYLSHDATSIQLYFQETLTFFVYTSEAVVALAAAPRSVE